MIDDIVTTFTGADAEPSGGVPHFFLFNFSASHDMLTGALNTPTFLALTSGGTGTSVFGYVGTGGALTKVTLTATAIACAGPLTLFNEDGNDEALSGSQQAFKLWKGSQLSDIAIANEYRIQQPVRTSSIYVFASMLNSGLAGTDWSGHGNTLTKTGTLPSSSIVPPVPYNGFPMMLGG